MAAVSVIICTRNRAEHLRGALQSLASVYIPEGWVAECVIIDNGSTDNTQKVIAESEIPQFETRVIREGRPGKSHAVNTALTQVRGDALLFTDDDVRVPENWVVGMTTPIFSGKADAVAGGVVLAPHLERPWQKVNPWLATPLAVTSVLSSACPQRLVGANMAISRSVFDIVPGFDVRLGPGSELGLGEETLLSEQIREAGFHMASAFDVVVEHHCSEDRLLRASYLKTAEQIGRSQGYIDYHWKQASVSATMLVVELAWRYAKLGAARVLRRDTVGSEGLPAWEMVLLTQIYHRRQLLAERGRARKYAASLSGALLPDESSSFAEAQSIQGSAPSQRRLHD